MTPLRVTKKKRLQLDVLPFPSKASSGIQIELRTMLKLSRPAMSQEEGRRGKGFAWSSLRVSLEKADFKPPHKMSAGPKLFI